MGDKDLFLNILRGRNLYRLHNRKEIIEEYKLVLEGLELYFKTTSRKYVDRQKAKLLSEDDKTKLLVVYFFEVDSFNLIVNILDLILIGCCSDAYALMRILLENQSILEYALNFNKLLEISDNYIFTRGHEYNKTKKIIKYLDKKDGHGRYDLWKTLSNYGSHSLYDRMQQCFSNINNKPQEILAGWYLSRQELIEGILNLLELVRDFINNEKLFYKKYSILLKNKELLKSFDIYLNKVNASIRNIQKELS